MSATAHLLAKFDTGTLAESGASALSPGLKPIWPSRRLVGRALTADCPAGENLMLHRAIARAGAGDVIVARCGGALHGYWGEVMTVAALSRGIVGLVIDGSVRDVEAIRELGFPVHAAGVAPAGTGKLAKGSVGAPIELRGAVVRPGDFVVADESGVVVVESHAVANVSSRAGARTEKERGILEGLRLGRTTIELLGLTAD
jgi:4-hydroxy-4-methyl-2-oxoglutarate aldolase